jgi:rhodanese-related sulfurtransferase
MTNIKTNISKIGNLLQKASAYGNTPSLTPLDSYELLQLDSKCILIDVRTKAELDWIGKPDIKAEQYVHIEWLFYPGSSQNPQFISLLKDLPKHNSLVFLCRSGIRSKMAVQTAIDIGMLNAIDILGGFEGQRSSQGHRKSVDGWCYSKLPWIGA